MRVPSVAARPGPMGVVRLFITVDTEFWPTVPDWRRDDVAADVARDLDGVTPEGRFGIDYQMDVLEVHGLKGVFFVESLFSRARGPALLGELVGRIQSRGHEVQLHVHPEWLPWLAEPILPGKTGQNLKEFTEDEQVAILGPALAALRSCGAADVCAFAPATTGRTSERSPPSVVLESRTTRATTSPFWRRIAACGRPSPCSSRFGWRASSNSRSPSSPTGRDITATCNWSPAPGRSYDPRWKGPGRGAGRRWFSSPIASS